MQRERERDVSASTPSSVWWWRWRRNVSFSLSASLSLFSALTLSSHAHLWSLKLSLRDARPATDIFCTTTGFSLYLETKSKKNVSLKPHFLSKQLRHANLRGGNTALGHRLQPDRRNFSLTVRVQATTFATVHQSFGKSVCFVKPCLRHHYRARNWTFVENPFLVSS